MLLEWRDEVKVAAEAQSLSADAQARFFWLPRKAACPKT